MSSPFPPNTVVTPAGQALASLHAPGCLLALIERTPAPELSAYLRGRQFSACQPVDVTMPVTTGAKAIECLLAPAGYPRHSGRKTLAVDIAQLMTLLAGLPWTRSVRMRLERVTTDACRFFHTDTLPLRLVCTYRGAGTEWLDDDACDRSGLGKGDNGLICRDRSGIHRMPEGWAGLMKGNRWTGAAGSHPGGLVHRSPPLYPGEWRLFLSLDALSA